MRSIAAWHRPAVAVLMAACSAGLLSFQEPELHLAVPTEKSVLVATVDVAAGAGYASVTSGNVARSSHVAPWAHPPKADKLSVLRWDGARAASR